MVGLEVGEAVRDDLGLPVTIYWQTLAPIPDRYKYILTLEEVRPDGTTQVLALTEREPYDGAIPTIYWQPNQTIVEYSELPPPLLYNLASPSKCAGSSTLSRESSGIPG